jgi:hypothetical protein
MMDFEQVKQEVEKAAAEMATTRGGEKSTEQVLTCHDARALAEELGVDYLTVGKACNEAGVKVRICELGCF